MTREELAKRLHDLIYVARHNSFVSAAQGQAREILDDLFPKPEPNFFLEFATNEIVASSQNLYMSYKMIPVKTMPFLVDEWKAGRIRDVTPGQGTKQPNCS